MPLPLVPLVAAPPVEQGTRYERARIGGPGYLRAGDRRAPAFLPTGNLWISLPEIGIDDGAVHAVGALIERVLGLVEAGGGSDHGPLIRPALMIDGDTVVPGAFEWERVGHWLPHFISRCPGGVLEGWICAPVDERGIMVRLDYRSHHPGAATVELGWTGHWGTTTVTHLRSKPIGGDPVGNDDGWTGSRTVSASAGGPLLSLAWQGGEGVVVAGEGPAPFWRASATGEIDAGQSLTAELFVGVATEPDGAATTALHLRRRGFDQLWAATTGWLADHALTVTDDRPGLAERINANLFFNYFFAQGDCLDTGRPVMVTSRSRRYYVSAAFWSRDAYCWTFPALLLTDPGRARSVLVSTIAAGGTRLADHALYLNGTSLYPGFELDEAAAPIIAVQRYVQMTGDSTVFAEPEVRAVLDGLATVDRAVAPSPVGPVRHLSVADRRSHRLPPTPRRATLWWPPRSRHWRPWTTWFPADRSMAGSAAAGLESGSPQPAPADRASAIRAAMAERLTVEARAAACGHGPATNPAVPSAATNLPWGCVRSRSGGSEPTATRCRWPPSPGCPRTIPITTREPSPDRVRLTSPTPPASTSPTDSSTRSGRRRPARATGAVPMDQGLACESWDVDTGRVRTGAAMASMAGLLAWTAWEHLSGPARWDRPRPR